MSKLIAQKRLTNLIIAFKEANDNANGVSGPEHRYWLGKVVGIVEATSIVMDLPYSGADALLRQRAGRL